MKKNSKINNIIKLILIFSIVLFMNANVFATTGVITETTVKLRSKASTDSTIVTLISIDEKVEILSQEGEWYKIKYKNATGYLRKDLVKVDGNTNTNTNSVTTNNTTTNTTTNTTPESNNAVNDNDLQIKIGDKSNINKQIGIRRVPRITSNEYVNINVNTEVEITNIINSWAKIKTSDSEGWIRVLKLKDAIKKEDAVSQEDVIQREATQTSLEQNTKVGFVNTDTLNLREKADKTSKIIKNLSKNQEVEVLEKADGWYKIKVSNVTGYVAEKYISDTKSEITSRSSDEDRENINSAVEKKQDEEIVASDVTTSDKGSQIVELAKEYLKTKYVPGGNSPETGFDCSGFTCYIYGKFNISLPRVSTQQINKGVEVKKTELQPGDLLIFNNSSNSGIGHVGIYIGNNQFIHASNPSPYPAGGVKITSLSDSYYSERFVSARRVI